MTSSKCYRGIVDNYFLLWPLDFIKGAAVDVVSNLSSLNGHSLTVKLVIIDCCVYQGKVEVELQLLLFFLFIKVLLRYS